MTTDYDSDVSFSDDEYDFEVQNPQNDVPAWAEIQLEKRTREESFASHKKRKSTRKMRTRAFANSDELSIYEIQSTDEQKTWYKYLFKAVRSHAYGCDAVLKLLEPSVDGHAFTQKLIEDTLVLLYDLSRSDGKASVSVAIVSFLQKRTGRPILSIKNARKGLELLMRTQKLLESMFDKMFMDHERQSDFTLLETLRNMLNKYELVRETPLVKKLYRFSMYALSLSLFGQFGVTFDSLRYSKLEQESLKKKFHAGPDFIHCLLDTILFICERGQQCMVTGSLDPIFHSGSAYEKWYAKSQLLKKESYYIPDLEGMDKDMLKKEFPDMTISREQYFADVEDLIEKGTSIVKFGNKLSKYEKSTLTSSLNDLQMMKANQISKRAAQKMRHAPFSLLVFGGSSVGKSSLMDLLFYQAAKVLHLPHGSEFRYTRNFRDEFWSGFSPAMWFVILDDIAFMHPNKAPNGDPSLMEGIQINNRVSLVTNQAELADKGKCPFRGRVVISSTNTPSLNAHCYYSCPLALQRRFPFMIDVTPKVQYCKEGQFLDATKVREFNENEKTSTDVFDDLWDIKLFKMTPIVRQENGVDYRENQAGHYVRIDDKGNKDEDFVFPSIYAFLAWYSKRMLEHEANEAMLDGACSDAAFVDICEKCFFPKVRCECAQVQGFDKKTLCELGGYFVRQAELMKKMGKTYKTAYADAAQRSHDNIHSGLDWDFHYEEMNHGLEVPEYIIAASEPVVEVQSTEEESRTYWQTFLLFTTYPAFWMFMNCYYVRWITMYAWSSYIGNKLVKNLMTRDFNRKSGFTRFCNWCGANWLATQWRRPIVKRILKDAGKKINIVLHGEAFRPIREYILGIVGGVFAVILMTKCLQWFFPPLPGKNARRKRQGLEESKIVDLSTVEDEGSKPIPRPVERDTVWQNQDYETTTFDVSPQSTSWSKMEHTEAVERLSRNCVYFESEYQAPDGRTARRIIRATGLCGHWYITNNHGLLELEEFQMKIVADRVGQGVGKEMTIKVVQKQIHRYPDEDLAFIELLMLPPVKDIRPLFSRESLRGSFNGTLVNRNVSGQLVKRTVKNVKRLGVVHHDLCSEPLWHGYCQDASTENGECGSMFVANSAFGPVILGIHVALFPKTNSLGLIAVNQEIIARLDECIDRPVIQSGEPMLSAPSAQRLLSPTLHFKSPITFMEKGTIGGVHGSFVGFRSEKKSTVAPTIFQDSMKKRGYEVKFGAPVMKGWRPWRTALKDLVDPVTQLNARVLDDCVDSLVCDLHKEVGSQMKTTLQVYDLETAVNGAPGVAYVDAMKRSTSLGCPWKKSKKEFFKVAEPRGEYQNPVNVDDEVLDRVRQMIDTYKEGKQVCPVFCANLKDEATKFKKIDDAKTRVFMGGPADWTIVVRKYFLSVVRLIQNNRYAFESGPGTNPFSLEWEEMYKYLTFFGKGKIVAGDFRAYDKRMAAMLMLKAFQVLIEICETSGNFSEEDLRVMWGIAEDTSFPLVDFNGDLLQLIGSNPSGHSLTVILNCIANLLYMRYCWSIEFEKREKEGTLERELVKAPRTVPADLFKTYVHLMTYGDDNIMGVSDTVKWFNHTMLRDTLLTIGVDYTMADKDAESVPYIDISEATFLKRYWRFDADLGVHVCPLEHDSIEKSLLTNTVSKSITIEEQGMQTLIAQIGEYFWYGRKTFEEKRAMFLDVIEENGLTYLYDEYPLPTWAMLKLRFETKGSKWNPMAEEVSVEAKGE
jgi:hypothetical protein